MRPRVLAQWTLLSALVVLEPSPVTAEEVTFRIAPERSEVAFDATYPLGDFSGTTKDVTGEIRFDPGDLTKPVAARVEVNPATLDTGLSGRDRDLREYLEVERFPTMQFVLTEIRAERLSLSDQVEAPVVILGKLTIHGVERAVEVRGKARLAEGSFRVEGITALKMTDYGIRRPTKLFLRVGEEVKVRFRVEAVRDGRT